MNKFTLYFVDKEMEKQYTQENMQYIRKILLYLFQSLMLFMGIMTIGVNTFNPSSNIYIFSIIIIACSTLALTATYFNIISYQTLVILCNFNIMLLQITVEKDTPSQQSFLRGSNIMMMHCSLISVCDFPQALLQIIVLYFFRILYASFQGQSVFEVIIAITLTSIVFSANCYRLSKINRKQYILRLSSIKWHNILQHVIEKKFIFFKYLSLQKQFQLIQSNIFDEQSQFIQYIREYKIGKQTIEQHLFHNYQFSLDISEICHVACSHSQEQQKFLLISFFVEFPNYIIIMDDQKNISQQLQNQALLMSSHYKARLKKFAKITLKSIHQAIEFRNLYILTKLRFVQFKYLIKQSPLTIKNINIFSEISVVVRMLYNKTQRVQIKSINTGLLITTIHSMFLLFIIEVLRQFTSRNIKIEIDQRYQPRYSFQYGQNTNLIVYLIFIGKLNVEKIEFEKFQQIITHYSLIKNKDNDQLVILLNQDISFQTQLNSKQ